MNGKKVEIDFGTVFPSGRIDQDKLVRDIEKSTQVNVEQIITDGIYRVRHEPTDRPLKLKVTVELSEG